MPKEETSKKAKMMKAIYAKDKAKAKPKPKKKKILVSKFTKKPLSKMTKAEKEEFKKQSKDAQKAREAKAKPKPKPKKKDFGLVLQEFLKKDNETRYKRYTKEHKENIVKLGKKKANETFKQQLEDYVKVWKPELLKEKPKAKAKAEPPKAMKDPTSGFRGTPITVGYGNKASPLEGEFDKSKMMLRFKTSSGKYHFGKEFGVDEYTEQHNKGLRKGQETYESGGYTYQQLQKAEGSLGSEPDYLKGGGFSLGQLGEGDDDAMGHNIVPYLKSVGQKYYAMKSMKGYSNRPLRPFMKGYEKGGRAFDF